MASSVSAEVAASVRDPRYQRRVAEALTEAHKRAKAADGGTPRDLDADTARIIIFSDQHKGVRNRADDFRDCERAYNAAIAYYFAAGHTLVELGDVEELWEERPGSVVAKYRHSLELSAGFQAANRYIRLYGNHDDAWSFTDNVARHLHPVFGDRLVVREAVRFRVVSGGRQLGLLFLIHGHQGTVTSDRLSRWSRLPVRLVWRPIQRLFRTSLNTPAKHWMLRERHNVAMYAWAAAARVVLIAGHTHRPVFMSETLSAKLEAQLRAVEHALATDPGNSALKGSVAELSAELEWARAQDRRETGPEGEIVRMERPCYFNTGCCCFADGDITGIEIADGEFRLVRWPDDADRPRPAILERQSVKDVFAAAVS